MRTYKTQFVEIVYVKILARACFVNLMTFEARYRKTNAHVLIFYALQNEAIKVNFIIKAMFPSID